MAAIEKKRIYKKPEMRKESKMTFPLEIINANGKKVVCHQCASCHGCR
jgi:cytochrome c